MAERRSRLPPLLGGPFRKNHQVLFAKFERAGRSSQMMMAEWPPRPEEGIHRKPRRSGDRAPSDLVPSRPPRFSLAPAMTGAHLSMILVGCCLVKRQTVYPVCGLGPEIRLSGPEPAPRKNRVIILDAAGSTRRPGVRRTAPTKRPSRGPYRRANSPEWEVRVIVPQP